MATGKKGFVLYADQRSSFTTLTNEEAGILIKHIFEYVNDESPVLTDRLLVASFEPIKAQLKRDLKRWENTVVKRSEAGKKGADKRWQLVANDSNAISTMANIAKMPVNVNDTVTVNDTVIINSEKNQKISITQYFIDFVNGSQIIDMARLRKLDLNFLQMKAQEFKQHCRPEYKDYGDFVYHFGNWLNKPTQQQPLQTFGSSLKLGKKQ